MQKLMRWVGSQGNWTCSEFSGLPAIPPEVTPAQQRWYVVAGGLALILSRLAPAELSAHYRHSHELHALIRRRLLRGGPVTADTGLLGEVMHEIAQVADATTRHCLNECFKASLRECAGDGEGPATARPTEPSSSMNSRQRSSRRSSRGAEHLDGASTSFSADLLQQRSSALRRSLAAARSTAFAELK